MNDEKTQKLEIGKLLKVHLIVHWEATAGDTVSGILDQVRKGWLLIEDARFVWKKKSQGIFGQLVPDELSEIALEVDGKILCREEY